LINLFYRFNPDGMNEYELQFHAKLEQVIAKESFEDTERYSIGKHLKKYGFYPTSLPILLHAMHGPSQWDVVTPHMLKSNSEIFGFYSKRLVEDWNSKSDKEVYLLKSPNHLYAKKVDKNPFAKGTIFFHSHSTFWTDRHTDYDVVFNEIKKLPPEFHPVSVCMHFVDIQKGLHKPYQEKGYPIYTAGNWNHPYFIENFYEIIRNFTYAVSNSLGSNVLYCIDFGMPFSLIKGYPQIIHNTDNNIKTTKPSIEHKQYQKNLELFTGIHTKISEAQQQLVNEELAPQGALSRLQLAIILYKAYLKFQAKRVSNILHTTILSIFRKMKIIK